MCQFRQNNPFLFEVAFASSQLGVGRLPVTEGLSRSLWDRVCLFEPIDYPPPFTIGGQCDGVLYESRLRRSDNTIQQWTSSSGGGAITGRIEILRARKFAQFDLPYPTSLFLEYKNTGGATRTRTFGAPSISQAVDISGWDYEFFRTDNQPDTCGNRPTDFPPLPQLPPVTNFPFTINLPDIGNVPVTVNLPDLNVQAWPQFNFEPIINIEGISFQFTPEGVNIDMPDYIPIIPRPTGGASSGDIQQIINNNNSEIENIINNNTTNNNSEVENIVNNVINQAVQESLRPLLCCMSENILKLFEAGEFNLLSNQYVNQSGGVYPLPLRCKGVIVSANQPVPTSIKGQAGSGSAPDVLFLGWVAFSIQGTAGGERLPWHFQEQFLTVPEGCNIVVVSSNYGATFNLSFVVSEPIEPNDCCA